MEQSGLGQLQQQPTGFTLVESMLFPRHFNEITLNQLRIDVELTSVPSGRLLYGLLSGEWMATGHPFDAARYAPAALLFTELLK